MIKILIFTVLFIINLSINSYSSDSVSIVLKVDNEIITNTDIKNESKYLIALNKDLAKLGNNEIYKIAKDSIVREKIKIKELKNYIDLDKFDDENLIQSVLRNFYSKLNIQNFEDFKVYLNKNDLSYANIRSKIKVEILWNHLISELYKKQVIINEKKIKEKIISEKLNEQQFLEYDLSEIVFSIDDENSYKETYSKISDSISKFGFKVTANKFSVADSNKFGGEIGIVNENQLSNLIREVLKNIEIGQFTKPILVANGYMILKVNDKKIINNELDEKKILKDLIEFEKKKQFNQFSAIHFNKAKINSKIR